jgi:transcriptional regulator GlxA family with amidase domain
MVLAMAGLIEGRPATTNCLGLQALHATGTVAIDARVVDDGNLVSGAGVTSGLDLALYLLERELGPQIAHAVEKLFAHERRGTVWCNTGPAPALSL